jgi:uncharacterized protein
MSVEHLSSSQRFVLRLAEGQAVLSYHMDQPDVMNIESTFVPSSARGRGFGGELVRAALMHARANRWRVIPTCWYVDTWVGMHPEFNDLLV